MTRSGKMFLAALPVALLLSAALRFIHHTDREYSYWIAQYGESVVWLEARCAVLNTPGACGTAQDRRSFVLALETYRDRVTAWWWPTLVLTTVAWIVALVSLIPLARRFLGRRSLKR